MFSIIIPTYNRASVLERTIRHLAVENALHLVFKIAGRLGQNWRRLNAADQGKKDGYGILAMRPDGTGLAAIGQGAPGNDEFPSL